MRFVVLSLALLGALGAAGGGAMWFIGGIQEISSHETRLRIPTTPSAARAEQRANLPMLVTLPYFLGAGCLLGLFAALLAARYRGKSACVLLLLAASGPIALAVSRLDWLMKHPAWLIQALAPCAILLIGGLLALLIRPKPALALEGGDDEDALAEDEEED